MKAETRRAGEICAVEGEQRRLVRFALYEQIEDRVKERRIGAFKYEN